MTISVLTVAKPTTLLRTFSIKDVQRQFGDNLRFVFRNFPLTTIHPYAEPAAEAAEAAGAGKVLGNA